MGTVLTFTSENDPLVKVSISCALVYGSKFHDKRINQKSIEVATGELITYDTGNLVCEGEMILKNVSYVDGEALRYWLQSGVIMQLYSFEVEADTVSAPEVDLGNGKGQKITGVKFNKTDTKSVFVRKAPGNYEIRFPYRFKRT